MKKSIRFSGVFFLFTVCPMVAAENPPALAGEAREARKAELKTDIERLRAEIEAHDQLIVNGTNGLTAFTFNDVRLGINLAEFQKRHPTSIRDDEQSDPKAGIETYRLENAEGADGAAFTFYERSLYRIHVVYLRKRIESLGGNDVIAARMWTKFGMPDDCVENDKAVCHIWTRPKIHRRANLVMLSTGDVSVLVVDANTESAVIQRRAETANTGF